MSLLLYNSLMTNCYHFYQSRGFGSFPVCSIQQYVSITATRKDISNHLREPAHQFGKPYKAASKEYEVNRSAARKIKATRVGIPGNLPQVYDSTIRKTLDKHHVFCCQRKPFLPKKNMATQCWFKNVHLNKPEDFWNNALRADKTKVETSGHNTQHHVCYNPTTHQHKLPHTDCQAWWLEG